MTQIARTKHNFTLRDQLALALILTNGSSATPLIECYLCINVFIFLVTADQV